MTRRKVDIILQGHDRASGVFRRVGREAKGFGAQLKGVMGPLGGIAGLGAGAAVGLGVVGVVRSLGSAFRELDSIGKTSDRLGIATEELTGLHVAADRSGVAVTTMNTALRKMIVNMSEAASGTGEALDAFEALGLDPATLNALSAADAFRQIAAAMGDIANQNDRVRITSDIFGGRGVEVLNTLELGREALVKYEAQAIRTGLAVGRDQITQIEAANDAVSRLGDSWDALWRNLATNVAPTVSTIADNMAAANEEAAGTGLGTLATIVGLTRPEALGFDAKKILEFKNAIAVAADSAREFIDMESVIEQLASGVDAADLSFERVEEHTSEIVEEARTTLDLWSGITSMMDQARGFVAHMTEDLAEQRDTLTQTSERLREMVMTDLERSQRDFGQAFLLNQFGAISDETLQRFRDRVLEQLGGNDSTGSIIDEIISDDDSTGGGRGRTSTQALQSRSLAGHRSSDDPLRSTSANTKKIADATQSSEKLLQEIADNTRDAGGVQLLEAGF